MFFVKLIPRSSVAAITDGRLYYVLVLDAYASSGS